MVLQVSLSLSACSRNTIPHMKRRSRAAGQPSLSSGQRLRYALIFGRWSNADNKTGHLVSLISHYICSTYKMATFEQVVWPHWSCGLLMSSFATTVKQLIATQGVICALGSGLLYAPTTLYLDDWFVRRKGLAYGIMSAGKSVAGIVLPFAMSESLERFGSKITLQGWTVAIVRHPTTLDWYTLVNENGASCRSS